MNDIANLSTIYLPSSAGNLEPTYWLFTQTFSLTQWHSLSDFIELL